MYEYLNYEYTCSFRGSTSSWINDLSIKSGIHVIYEKSELGFTSKMLWIEAVQNRQFFEGYGNARFRVEQSLKIVSVA